MLDNEESPINDSLYETNDGSSASINDVDGPSKIKENSVLNPEDVFKKSDDRSERTTSTVIGSSPELPNEEISSASSAPINISIESKEPTLTGSSTNFKADTASPINQFSNSLSSLENSISRIDKLSESINYQNSTINNFLNSNSLSNSSNSVANNYKNESSEYSVNSQFSRIINDSSEYSNSPITSSVNNTLNVSDALSVLNETKNLLTSINSNSQNSDNLSNSLMNENITNNTDASNINYSNSSINQSPVSIEKTNDLIIKDLKNYKESSDYSEVIKTNPTFLEKIQSYFQKSEKLENSNLPTETSNKSESPVTIKEISTSVASDKSSSEKIEKITEKPTVINTIALENRLARIEYILSNTLEVKIVD